MESQNWLLLTDYASKYRISVSTLRRRIKSHQIPFRFEHGKYLILDGASQEQDTHAMNSIIHQTESSLAARPSEMAAHAAPLKFSVDLPETKIAQAELEEVAAKDGPLISTATKLLNELKRAYMSVLQEKESQMIHLKQEVSDLKTLVRVLEDDNDRLNSLLGFRSPLK